VARGIVEGLSLELSDAESRALARRPLEDVRAWESYLRARHEAWRFSGPSLERARRFIDAALGIVGENELLYSTLGHILAMSIEAGVAPGPDTVDEVERLADRVFSLDPTSPRGHWLKAFCAFQKGRLHAAIRAGLRALTLDPEDPDTLLLLGYVQGHAGRTVEARALLEQAVELDPLTPVTRCMPGFVDMMEGRFDAAVEPYRQMAELDPDGPFALVTYGWALAYAERLDEAIDVFQRASSKFPGTPFASWAESFTRSLQGDPTGAREAITPAFVFAAGSSGMFARALTHCYARAGDLDEGFRWLDRVIDLGLWNLDFLETHDRFLEPLRSDPRFGVAMERVRDLRRGLGEVSG
jgi:tetratricopeptide (TPR) repeat protein